MDVSLDCRFKSHGTAKLAAVPDHQGAFLISNCTDDDVT